MRHRAHHQLTATSGRRHHRVDTSVPRRRRAGHGRDSGHHRAAGQNAGATPLSPWAAHHRPDLETRLKRVPPQLHNAAGRPDDGGRRRFRSTAFSSTAPCGAVSASQENPAPGTLKRAERRFRLKLGHAGKVLQRADLRRRQPSPKIGRPVALRDSSAPNFRASLPLTPRQATDGKRSTKQQIPAPRPPGRPLQPQVEDFASKDPDGLSGASARFSA